jgi:hypothetical protein
LNTKAISWVKLAAWLRFHDAVHQGGAPANEVLGVPARVGETSGLQGLGKLDVVATQEEGGND